MKRSTFYYVKERLNKPDQDSTLKDMIQTIAIKHKRRYGYRRMVLALRNEHGLIVNHKKVIKLMRALSVQSIVRRKKYKSYKGEVGKIAPNVLNRDFTTTQPNQKWVTDLTEFKINDRKIYLSPIMDLHTKEILSYNIGFSPNVNLVTEMLDQAINVRDTTNLTIHSDQGFHYQNRSYISRLEDNQITQSMSRKGNCLDNAVIENFFGILKSEMYYTETFKSPTHFIRSLEAYIKYYNEERISTKLKGMTPAQYHHHSLTSTI